MNRSCYENKTAVLPTLLRGSTSVYNENLYVEASEMKHPWTAGQNEPENFRKSLDNFARCIKN